MTLLLIIAVAALTGLVAFLSFRLISVVDERDSLEEQLHRIERLAYKPRHLKAVPPGYDNPIGPDRGREAS